MRDYGLFYVGLLVFGIVVVGIASYPLLSDVLVLSDVLK